MEGLKWHVQLRKSFNYFVVYLAGARVHSFFATKCNEAFSTNFLADSFFLLPGAKRVRKDFSLKKTSQKQRGNNRVADNSTRSHLLAHGRHISWRGKLCRWNSYLSLIPTPLCGTQPSPPPLLPPPPQSPYATLPVNDVIAKWMLLWILTSAHHCYPMLLTFIVITHFFQLFFEAYKMRGKSRKYLLPSVTNIRGW